MKGFSQDPTGLAGKVSRRVDTKMTASAVGSGGVDVLSTPTMILLLEMAAVNAVSGVLAEGYVTLGTGVNVRHLAATPLGDTVIATAEVSAVEGRRLTFALEARDSGGIVGNGTHVRMAVDRHRFMASLHSI